MLASPTSGTILQVDGAWIVEVAGVRHPLRQRGHTPAAEEGLELPRAVLGDLPAPFAAEDLRWVTRSRPTDPEDVLDGLKNCFAFRTEDRERKKTGLRVPQAGALHAVLAHWSTGSLEPATVVLPTGTGKTETMVALMASERLERVLVLVPSDALRAQISEAFESYGVLPAAGVLCSPSHHLVVGRIGGKFKDAAAAIAFADRCNVIVTTPDALRASSQQVVSTLVDRCSHLFVDEAHHVVTPGAQ